jgi:fumarate reductase flavoprotein subunit
MEMVQYHPTGLPFTGILITEASRAEGGYLLNKDGYRYLQDYNLGKPHKDPVFRSMELGPRDRLSQAFVKEKEKGRTIKGPYGDVVHLDLRHLGEDKINAKLPMVRELCVKYENIDPVHELVPVRPVQHYMMGGIHTDTNGATPLKGLYAAGEAACVSLNGANRLGSNSLGELLVFGARAGRAAAEYASGAAMPGNNPVLALGADEERRINAEYIAKTSGSEKISVLREAMQHAMEDGAGIYRTRASLAEAVERIAEMQERYRAISLEDHSLAFNTQLVAALELGFLLDTAEAILQCALQREESRGAHQREDFPERDDQKFLAHSIVHKRQSGRPEVSYLPVTITRWPPGKRVYGEQSSDGGHNSH